MPTFGKLTAAVLFAALAYYVSLDVQALFIEERPLPTLAYWNVLFGAICGWRIGGARAGQGATGAIGYGLTATAALAATALFFHSGAEMIKRSLRNQYDGPVEGIISIMELMLDFGQRIATPEILAMSFGGGVAIAIVADFVGRRYD